MTKAIDHTMSKIERTQRYLRQMYGWDCPNTNAAYDILLTAKYEVRNAELTRVAGRKAARKYGERCITTLICNEHPISRTIDDLSANEAIRYAVKAAKNAFWAHPELREAA